MHSYVHTYNVDMFCIQSAGEGTEYYCDEEGFQQTNNICMQTNEHENVNNDNNKIESHKEQVLISNK